MHDGHTKKVERQPEHTGPRGFLESRRAAIVTLAGLTAGNEYELQGDRTVIGRGPDVDIAFDDRTMSRQHAAFEVMDGAMWLRDLGSTNQVLVNGGETLSAELKNGDKIELGEHEFQFVLEGRKRDPKTYRLEDD